VAGAVAGAVHGAVDGAVGGAVAGAVGGAVDGAVGGAVDGAWWKRFGGAWWLAWPAWRRFFHDHCDLDLPGDLWDRNTAYSEMLASAGWSWPHRQFVVVADRPAAIHRERVGPDGWGSHRLHCETGPAVQHRDGWGLWFWHGINVPQWVVSDPTPEAIAAETNTELRRCAIESYGWDRWLDRIGAECVSCESDPGNPGRDLRLFDLPSGEQVYPEPVRLLVMHNASLDRDGSRRRFAETVPADVGSAVAAAAWQSDVPEETYRQLGRAT
jgi:hypothetical protein